MHQRSLLVVDAQDTKEPCEGYLVEQVARNSGWFQHVVRLPYLPHTHTPWTVVWYAGHVTTYRALNLGALDRRVGGRFWRIGTVDDVRTIDARLLVLSACNTFGGPFAGDYKAPMVVSHKGKVLLSDALVFAARFMTTLTHAPKRKLTHEWVQAVFAVSKKASDDDMWRFTQRRE